MCQHVVELSDAKPFQLTFLSNGFPLLVVLRYIQIIIIDSKIQHSQSTFEQQCPRLGDRRG